MKRLLALVVAAAAFQSAAWAQAPMLPPPAPGQGGAAIDGADGGNALEEGPLHEAFAEPVELDARPHPVLDRKPPDAIKELPPEVQPEGKNVEWIPGYWDWSDPQKDFVWVSGVWRDIPAGRRWAPGYWTKVAGGFQRISGFWAPEAEDEIAFLPQPPATLEAGPNSPAPGNNYFWVPGCWLWQNTGYAWRGGYWYLGQPNWVWTPDHYCWTPRGVVFIPGFWDRTLLLRGLAYAPIWWPNQIYTQPGWCFRPTFAINSGCLLSALYVGGSGGYFFGIGNSWGHGCRPWYDFHHHGHVYDPLCHYHRWHDGHNQPGWADNVATQFHRDQQALGPNGGVRGVAGVSGEFHRGDGAGRTALVARADHLAQNQGAGAYTRLRSASPGELAVTTKQLDGWKQLERARSDGEGTTARIGRGQSSSGRGGNQWQSRPSVAIGPNPVERGASGTTGAVNGRVVRTDSSTTGPGNPLGRRAVGRPSTIGGDITAGVGSNRPGGDFGRGTTVGGKTASSGGVTTAGGVTNAGGEFGGRRPFVTGKPFMQDGQGVFPSGRTTGQIGSNGVTRPDASSERTLRGNYRPPSRSDWGSVGQGQPGQVVQHGRLGSGSPFGYSGGGGFSAGGVTGSSVQPRVSSRPWQGGGPSGMPAGQWSGDRGMRFPSGGFNNSGGSGFPIQGGQPHQAPQIQMRQFQGGGVQGRQFQGGGGSQMFQGGGGGGQVLRGNGGGWNGSGGGGHGRAR